MGKKKLPTAIQWEKAARGGSKGYEYPWGNKKPHLKIVNANVPAPIHNFKNFIIPSFKPHEVDRFDNGICIYGCYNLAGNVHEWCEDLININNNTSQLPGREYRISKGGSFSSYSIMLSSWFEQPFLSITHRNDLGFRCIVEAEE